MEKMLQEIDEARKLMDDCAAMCEAYQCMKDKGVLFIDADGVTLKEEAFDRCFPGHEWKHSEDGDYFYKSTEYRGFIFDTIRPAE